MSILGATELGFAGLSDYVGLTTGAAATVYANQEAADYQAAHGEPLSAADYQKRVSEFNDSAPANEQSLFDGVISDAAHLPQKAVDYTGNLVESVAAHVGAAEQSLLGPLVVAGVVAAGLLGLWFFGPELKLLAKKVVG